MKAIQNENMDESKPHSLRFKHLKRSFLLYIIGNIISITRRHNDSYNKNSMSIQFQTIYIHKILTRASLLGALSRPKLLENVHIELFQFNQNFLGSYYIQ